MQRCALLVEARVLAALLVHIHVLLELVQLTLDLSLFVCAHI